MVRKVFIKVLSARLLVLAAVVCLSTLGLAGQDDLLDDTKDVIIDEPADKVEDVFDKTEDVIDDDDDGYKSSDEEGTYRQKPSESGTSACQYGTTTTTEHQDDETEMLELKDIDRNPEEFYGKTVTVEAELDDIFTDKAFTIQDDGHELLVINDGPQRGGGVALIDDEWEDGNSVHVTGVVEPYDRTKLECRYGPLQMERKEGDSFTRSPVIIVKAVQEARLEPLPAPAPIMPEPVAPAPIMPEPPAPALEKPSPPVIEEEVAKVEEPTALPRTSSGIPLIGSLGLLSLLAGFGLRLFRR